MMKQTVNPQKRHKSLVPLSREHHFGLLFCWKIRQGLKNGTDLEVLRAYVNYFWENILKAHCEEEEWVLKKLLKANNAICTRLAEEHKMLHTLIEIIESGSPINKQLFEVLENDLTDHIRWEERELFPYLQTVANANDLELTGQLLNHNHAPRIDNFAPEFWLVKAQPE